MEVLKLTCNLLSSFTAVIFILCGFGTIQDSNGLADFTDKPGDMDVKTGSNVTFVWIYDGNNEPIEKGELWRHIDGNDLLLFKVDPINKKTQTFVKPEYEKRVNITVPAPFKSSCVSAKMVLSNVTTVDTGFYSFKVFPATKPEIIISNVSLYVTERPHSLNINNTNITKEVGESLNVNCQVSGVPTPKVTWVNKNNRQESVGQGSAVLSLSNITKQHEGTYTCKGENSEGNVQSSIILTVTSCKRPHSLNINNTNITKEVGESLNVNCQVSGVPTPKVTWVNKNNRQESVGQGSAVLSLSNITKQHEGTYTCKGENSEGNVQSSIILTVTSCSKTSGTCQLSYSVFLLTAVVFTTILL